jgi:hypothetical protein
MPGASVVLRPVALMRRAGPGATGSGSSYPSSSSFTEASSLSRLGATSTSAHRSPRTSSHHAVVPHASSVAAAGAGALMPGVGKQPRASGASAATATGVSVGVGAPVRRSARQHVVRAALQRDSAPQRGSVAASTRAQSKEDDEAFQEDCDIITDFECVGPTSPRQGSTRTGSLAMPRHRQLGRGAGASAILLGPYRLPIGKA